MPTTMTSRQFNQDTSRAKKAAESGPVVITDRGRPAHVLLTFHDYERLLGPGRLIDLLGEPAGVAEVELVLSTPKDVARPASFD
jgi:prevent-host-death family protein